MIMKGYVNGELTVMNAAICEFNKLLTLIKDRPLKFARKQEQTIETTPHH